MIFSLALVIIFLEGLSGDALTDKDVSPIFAATTYDEAVDIWNELAHKHSPDSIYGGEDIWETIDNQRSDIAVKMMEHLYNHEMKGKSFVMAATPLLFELAMVCIGANEETLEQCIKVLGEGASQPAVNAIYHIILKYQLDEKIVGDNLKLLNLIYVDKKFKVEDDCTTAFKNIFISEIHNVSFVTKELSSRAQEINRVGKARCGMDKLVIESDLKDTVMLLISAVRFKGKWVTPFPKAELKNFYNEDRSLKGKVKMMSGVKQYLKYKEKKDFQMVALPYKGKGSSVLYFVIYLPKEGKTVTQVLEKVKSNGKFINTFTESVKNTIVNVTMPEFKITNKVSMEGAFKSLGFTNAFNSEKANFTKLSKTSTYISGFWQELFIQVNQEGTMGGTRDQNESRGAPRGMIEEKEFNAERPFVWMVADLYGNIILNGIYVGDIVPETSGIVSTMANAMKRLSGFMPGTAKKPTNQNN